MEKKRCLICNEEFESENEQDTLCQECKMSKGDENPVAQDACEIEEDITEVYETEEGFEQDAQAEEVLDGSDETEYETEVGAEILEEELSEEELYLIEQAKIQKKNKIIKITATILGVIALIAVILFVPFKKDEVANKRTNLYTIAESAVLFNFDQDTAMVIGGEKIHKSVYNYFFERAQYNLLMDNGVSETSTPEEINGFWEKDINGKNAKEIAIENAEKDILQFVLGRQAAEKNGIEMTGEELENLNEYMSIYITNEFLGQMNLTRQQVSYILEGSTLISKYMEKRIGEDDKYNLTNDAVEKYIKEKGELITAKHILFSTIDPSTYQPLSDDEIASVDKKAKETLEKIKNGEDFDTLMNELSEDPGLALSPDGYTFGKGDMVADFEQAAFNLKENEVSEIVKSDLGYHIIKRVPLVLTDTEIENEKETMQTEIFDKEVLERAKRTKIMYNNRLIKTIEVVKY